MDPGTPNDSPSERAGSDRFGRTNWLLLATGVLLLVVGFATLSMADETASNLAGRLSPFVILGAKST